MKPILIVFALLGAAHTASAAEIWTSEAECLQRQVQLKRLEDSLALVSAELARASLDLMPEAKLGGKITEAKETADRGVKQMREALKDVCSKLYP